MKLSESQISDQVKGFMLAHGWRAIRNTRAVVPGMFQAGEPGIPDYLFIRYIPSPKVYARSLNLWVEFKTPQDQRQCRCLQNLGTKKRCTVCDQKNWQERERAAGGQVWVVNSLDNFTAAYYDVFGWLHSGPAAVGQTELAL